MLVNLDQTSINTIRFLSGGHDPEGQQRASRTATRCRAHGIRAVDQVPEAPPGESALDQSRSLRGVGRTRLGAHERSAITRAQVLSMARDAQAFLVAKHRSARRAPFSRAGQSLARVMNNSRFARMMVMFLDGVHRVGGRGAVLVNPGHGAVADRAAIVPGHSGASRYRLERRCFLGCFLGCFFGCFLGRHNGFLSLDESASGDGAGRRRGRGNTRHLFGRPAITKKRSVMTAT